MTKKSKYIVFNAQEGAALALLARSPASFDAVKSQLSPQGLQVATLLCQGGPSEDFDDPSIQRTAEYFAKWAKDYKTKSVDRCPHPGCPGVKARVDRAEGHAAALLNQGVAHHAKTRQLEAELAEARVLNAQLAAQVDDARRQRDEAAEVLSRAKAFVTDEAAALVTALLADGREPHQERSARDAEGPRSTARLLLVDMACRMIRHLRAERDAARESLKHGSAPK